MDSEKNICEKCKQLLYCDKHHILPKGIFGDGETIYLCKKCHHEFHKVLGKKYEYKKNKQSIEFYLQKWYTWLYLSITIGIAWFLFS